MPSPPAPPNVHDALGLSAKGEIVSIVGGGGKSTLLFALADAPARWVLTTTTRMFAAQISQARAHCETQPDALALALREKTPGLLVIGAVEGDKALGVPASLPAELLRHPDVDCVAIEADGSRMLPTKAPAEHEPVIAAGTTLTVVVAGIDALDGPIEQRAHRPERVAAITGQGPSEPLSAAALARLLTHPDGGLKGVPESSRVAILLNKVESDETWGVAREVARLALAERRIDRVILGALRRGAPLEVCSEASGS